MPAHEVSTSPTLLRALSGPASAEAWAVFVERYSPFIANRCRRAGLQSADADDVRQQVLAQLVSALGDFRYDPARRFRGYLSRAIENVIATRWRELARRPGAVGRGGTGLPAALAALPVELDDLVRDDLRAASRTIEVVRFEVGPDAWAAFWFTAVDGLSGDEAAARLGKKVSAVYAAKSRVLAKLRSSFETSGGPTGEAPGDRPSD